MSYYDAQSTRMGYEQNVFNIGVMNQLNYK